MHRVGHDLATEQQLSKQNQDLLEKRVLRKSSNSKGKDTDTRRHPRHVRQPAGASAAARATAIAPVGSSLPASSSFSLKHKCFLPFGFEDVIVSLWEVNMQQVVY